jgi:predicted phage terminase large subunit-like protein
MGNNQDLQTVFENPLAAMRKLVQEDFYQFIQYFWPEYSADEFIPNWHIRVIADELQDMAERVAEGEAKKHDLIINVPPGSSKTYCVSIAFPIWCWCNWYWMRFITASYSSRVSLESAVYARDILRSARFRQLFPELGVKRDKDTKENYRVVKYDEDGNELPGGNRFSSSIGGTMMGFHGNFLIMDDPIDPASAEAEAQVQRTNRWINSTFLTRKVQKEITPYILIQQRIHQDDPTGHALHHRGKSIRHICLPGEIKNYPDEVKPKELKKYYSGEGLLDPRRLSWKALNEEAQKGQFHYASQIGQKPVPPGGGLFKADRFQILDQLPSNNIQRTVRYWDKAGTAGGGDYTVGVKMHQLKGGYWLISDMKRGQWGSDERERIIKETARADGPDTEIWIEVEPGSGGKESAEATVRNLAGFAVYMDRPTGDKVKRADSYSVQVNNGNVWLMRGDWNTEFIEEHRYFPYSRHKDICDSCSGAFAHLVEEKEVIIW